MSKPTALLAFLGKADIVSLCDYLRRNRRTVFLPPAAIDPEALRAIEATGSQVKRLTLAVGESARNEARNAVTVARAALQATAVPLQLRYARADAATRAVYEQVLDANLASVTSLLDELEQIRGEYFVESLLLSDEKTWLGKTAAAWAKQHDIPSILVAHGAGLETDFAFAHYACETVVVDGLRGAEYCADRGVARGRIQTIGNVQWDVFNRLKLQKETLRRELRARAGLDASSPIIAYGLATDAVNPPVAPDRLAGELSEFLGIYRHLAEQGIKPHLVVVGQSANDGGVQDRLDDLARRLEIPQDRLHHAAADAESWIAAADVLVSREPRLAVEALLAETPAISLMTPLELIAGPAFGPDDGVVCCEAAALGQTVFEVLASHDLKVALTHRMRNAAMRFNFGVDGMAAKRLCDLIDRDSRINPADGFVSRLRRSARRTLPAIANNAKHAILVQANRFNQMNRLLRWKKRLLGK